MPEGEVCSGPIRIKMNDKAQLRRVKAGENMNIMESQTVTMVNTDPGKLGSGLCKHEEPWSHRKNVTRSLAKFLSLGAALLFSVLVTVTAPLTAGAQTDSKGPAQT